MRFDREVCETTTPHAQHRGLMTRTAAFHLTLCAGTPRSLLDTKSTLQTNDVPTSLFHRGAN